MSDTPTRIILIRHGRTALNAEGRLRGLADPELDDTGLAEAQATAAALAPAGLSLVLSSPLRRATRTAEIIAQAVGAPHRVDPAFNDRDYGPWTGHVKADVVSEWGSVDAAPGVEEENVVLGRALQALKALTYRDDGPVGVVTHDAVIRPILESIQPGIRVDVETGSWAELVHHGGQWTILSADNTADQSQNESA
ncbi:MULTISPECIES: histidine phosphatase family protein [unclassified Microbacterium]|uniref:histidine phosphatase family protein n=1 Tax=unclassified Microbacterium TaxID=2609290 RepID=UPI00301B3624